MLKHIVMFKLHDTAEGATKYENALNIKAVLEELPDKISEIKEFEIGINVNESERAMDMVVYSIFDDNNALERYLNHPEHLKAVEYVSRRRSDSKVVDFEI